ALCAGLGGGRRDGHARIAEIADEPLLRAKHLALVREEPDAEVAAELETAAALAGDRGARAAAAELAEQALRLTPETARDERRRRALAAAPPHPAPGTSRRREMDSRTDDRRRAAGGGRGRLDARRSARPARRARERRPRGGAARGGARGCRLTTRAAVGHPLPPRLGDAVQEGLRAR